MIKPTVVDIQHDPIAQEKNQPTESDPQMIDSTKLKIRALKQLLELLSKTEGITN